MTDFASASVLADVSAWMIAALVLGMGVYQARRSLLPMMDWSTRGKVRTESYNIIDGAVVLGFAWAMWMGLRSVAVREMTKGTEAAALKAAETAIQGPGAVEMMANAVVLLMFSLALLFYLRQIRGLDPVELFGIRRLGAWKIAAGACLWLVPLLVAVTACNWLAQNWLKEFWPDLAPQDTVRLFLENNHLGSRVIMAITAVIVAPLVEEIVFRGFVYGVVKRFTDPIFAALLSSALFALAHFHLGSAVPLFVLALGFVVAYERTGSLLVPMLMHGMFNGFSILALFFLERNA